MKSLLNRVVLSFMALSGVSLLAGRVVLDPSDFHFKGVIPLASTQLPLGSRISGLAMRQRTQTYFVLGKSGLDPYHLFEVRLKNPATSNAQGKMEIVKYWGPLNANGKLNLSGQSVSIKGLLFDDKADRLWFSIGSYYSNKKNLPFLGYVSFENNEMQVHGLWGVDPSVHSDTVKGSLFEAPEEIQQVTGNRFMSFGVRGSTAQLQSWGIGLVSVAEPSGLAEQGLDRVKSPIPAKRIIHWPFLGSQSEGRVSNFQKLSGDRSIEIQGNELVTKLSDIQVKEVNGNRVTMAVNILKPEYLSEGNYTVSFAKSGEEILISKMVVESAEVVLERSFTKQTPKKGDQLALYRRSFESNRFIDYGNFYSPTDTVDSAVWIKTLKHEGLLYFGTATKGYSWYGLPNAHRDESYFGNLFKNNLGSLLYPGKPLSSIFEAKGYHVEAAEARYYMVDPEKVLRHLTGADKLRNDEVSPSVAGNLSKLGTTQVPIGGDKRCGDLKFDPNTSILMAICPDANGSKSALYQWEVE